MISFLASPKPFQGSSKEHQYRAIRSWQATAEDAEVILYGDSAGIDEAGDNLGVQVVKQVDCAPSGIPYFGAIAEHAAVHGKHDLQVYLNCDILLSGIGSAMRRIRFPQFLMIGQLIDLGDGLFVDVTQVGWQAALRQLAGEGKVSLRGPAGVDYFGFRRGTWRDFPPVVIGRAGYDGALLAYCLCQQIPIIDTTFAVTALHQSHDYSHVQGGKQTVYHGADAQNNLHHAGSHSLATISDADYVLRGSVVRRWPCRGDWLRRLELVIRYRLGWATTSLGVRLAWRVLHLIGVSLVVAPTLEEVIEALPLDGRDLRN
jgi:hypothetical protein